MACLLPVGSNSANAAGVLPSHSGSSGVDAVGAVMGQGAVECARGAAAPRAEWQAAAAAAERAVVQGIAAANASDLAVGNRMGSNCAVA